MAGGLVGWGGGGGGGGGGSNEEKHVHVQWGWGTKQSICMKSMILYKLLAFHNLFRININQFNYLIVPLGYRTHVNI